MYTKIEIKGEIKLETGMHIGAGLHHRFISETTFLAIYFPINMKGGSRSICIQ